MQKPTLYVETSVVSYLTGRPSSDLIVAAHQKATQDWWVKRSGHFELLISKFVSDEIQVGHPEAAQRLIGARKGQIGRISYCHCFGASDRLFINMEFQTYCQCAKMGKH
jgi:hypothetical protein